MRDELFDRDYQAGRDALHDGIDRLVGLVRDSIIEPFRVLERIQFDAPWAPPKRRTARRGRAGHA